MGYIIKISDDNRNTEILSCSETTCCLGLDKRGIPLISNSKDDLFVSLFDIEQKEDLNSAFKAECSELTDSLQKSITETSLITFNQNLKINWRDLCFEIIYISSASFAYAKAGYKKLLSEKARYHIECKERGIKIPLKAGVSLTIGSHVKDSVQITLAGIKPKHAIVSLSEDEQTLEISAILGKIENKVESGISIFKLMPAGIQFEVKAL